MSLASAMPCLRASAHVSVAAVKVAAQSSKTGRMSNCEAVCEAAMGQTAAAHHLIEARKARF